jgi:hypothetical protein
LIDGERRRISAAKRNCNVPAKKLWKIDLLIDEG